MHTLLAWLLALFQVPGNTPVAGAFSTGTVPATPFITAQSIGTPRNDFTGCVGMEFQAGASVDLTVSDLSRWVISGNSGSHTLKLLDVTGSNLIASASVNTSGAPAGAYLKSSITPVTIEGNSKYLLMSTETASGDQWSNSNTTVTPSSDGTVLGAVSVSGACPGGPTLTGGSIAFVPVNFDYVASTPTTHTLVNSQTIGSLRNDVGGCLGLQFTVGGANITLTGIGRWVIPGNSASHVLYVTNTSGTSLASVTVNTSGATVNRFLYGSVSNTTLTAGTTYNVYSTEVAAGDQWSDNNATVGNTLAATIGGGAVNTTTCPGTAGVFGGANHSYVPVSIQYQ